MSWQDKVAGGSPRANTPWPLPGQYLVDIEVVKYISGFKGESFVIEQKVVESNVVDRPKGLVMADVYNFKHDAAQDDVLTFLMQALGNVDKDKITKQVIDAVVAEGNPLRNTRLKVMAYNKKTKAGKDFTVVKYEFVAKAAQVGEQSDIGLAAFNASIAAAPTTEAPPAAVPVDDDIPF